MPIWVHWPRNSKMYDEIMYPFPNFNGCTVEVWVWIRNSISHYIINMITYPCRDCGSTMFVKGSRGIFCISLRKADTNMYIGINRKLEVYISPKNCIFRLILWKSSAKSSGYSRQNNVTIGKLLIIMWFGFTSNTTWLVCISHGCTNDRLPFTERVTHDSSHS